MAIAKVYNGSSWVTFIPKTHDGSAWEDRPYFWDGSAWEPLFELVALVGGVFFASSVSPTDAVSQYRLLSSGSEQRNTTGTWVTLGTWLISGAASDYDVRWSASGDTGSLSGSAINSWLNLGTSRSWALTDSSPIGTTLEVTGLMEIRPAGGGSTLASATVTLRANESA